MADAEAQGNGVEEQPVDEPVADEPVADKPAADEPVADDAAKVEDAPKEDAPEAAKDDQKEDVKDEAAKDAKDAEAPKEDKAKEEAVSNEEEKKEPEAEPEPEPAKPPSEYQLYYWQGSAKAPFGGRGGVIRLALALCECDWEEGFKGADSAKMDKIGKTVKGTETGNFPTFAYPILRHNIKMRSSDADAPPETKEMVISQTAAIVAYVLSANGYCPSNKTEELQSLSTALTALDAWNEWAGKVNKVLGYDKWISNRIGSFVDVFQAVLKRNNEGKGWMFGDNPSVADLCVVDLMRRYRHVKPDHYKNNKCTELKEMVSRFEAMPQVKKFLESDDYKPNLGGKGFGAL